MGTKFQVINVRITPDVYDRLAEVAQAQKLTRGEIVRAALDLFLLTSTHRDESQRRLARLSEFQHLALDIIIREQYPEYRDRLIAETDKRVGLYHGA